MIILRKLRAAQQRWSNWRGTHNYRFSITYRSSKRAVTARVFDRTTRKDYSFQLRAGTTDLQIFLQTWVDRQYDLNRLVRCQDLLNCYHRTIASGTKPLIVDLGANCGITSAYFRILFPGAEVVAIEPEESNYEALCVNVDTLDVYTRRAAAGSYDGYAELNDPGHGQWAFRTTISSARTALPLVSIPTLLAEHRACSPFLMKIDVEGAEKDLFSGNTDWVDQFAILAIELHDWMLPKQNTAQPFLRVIAGLERDFVTNEETVFSIGNNLRC